METDVPVIFLAKAHECLAGAHREFINGRFNNCANRRYDATFQAAIAALLDAAIQPTGAQWGHDFVQAPFNRQLINRRTLDPTSLRNTLEQNDR